MKLTSKERREVTRLRESGESDFERDHGRPPGSQELEQIHDQARKAITSLRGLAVRSRT